MSHRRDVSHISREVSDVSHMSRRRDIRGTFSCPYKFLREDDSLSKHDPSSRQSCPPFPRMIRIRAVVPFRFRYSGLFLGSKSVPFPYSMIPVPAIEPVPLQP